MSNAGRGKPNQIPGMRMNGNVPNMQIPPDVIWDENDPPRIYDCSQHTEHQPTCDGNCESRLVVSEKQAELMNEARAWARLEMPFNGVPFGLPFPGIPVEVVDLLCWLEVTKEQLYEAGIVEEFEFEEKYRDKKLELLRTIRSQHEDRIKRQRVASSLGIIERPPLLGPDGQPIG
jgi:hypothetical protein